MKRKTVLYIISIPAVLVVCFILAPILINPSTGLIPTRFQNMADTKDYYSTLAAIVTILLGLAGLLLGFFYYENKKKVDSELIARENIRKRLNILMSELNTYDKNLHRVFYVSVRDSKELVEVRAEIHRTFDGIETMLDEGLDLLGLTKEDMQKILKVNSYVDKCDEIMHHRLSQLNHDKLYPIRDRYAELIKTARRACYLRIK